MNRSRFAAVFAATAILFGLSTLPPAQAAAGAGGGAGAAATQAGQRLKAALSQLDLSAAQITQIKQILANAKTQLHSAPAGGKRAVIHKVIKQILGVLTKPQKVKFIQIMKSYKSRATA
jgi:Spy/CpxP family protein refolding chaperone